MGRKNTSSHQINLSNYYLLDHNLIYFFAITTRAATAGKAGKVWSLPRFWVSICSYKKQLVKEFWGRILDLAWLKFAVAALTTTGPWS
jgi:hypothetical protein